MNQHDARQDDRRHPHRDDAHPLESYDEPLLTIRNFATQQEAAVAQGVLENHRIPSYVQGGQVATMLFYIGTALGGVKLQVPQSLAEEAAELLSGEFVTPDDVPAWRCPDCGGRRGRRLRCLLVVREKLPRIGCGGNFDAGG